MLVVCCTSSLPAQPATDRIYIGLQWRRRGRLSVCAAIDVQLLRESDGQRTIPRLSARGVFPKEFEVFVYGCEETAGADGCLNRAGTADNIGSKP